MPRGFTQGLRLIIETRRFAFASLHPGVNVNNKEICSQQYLRRERFGGALTQILQILTLIYKRKN